MDPYCAPIASLRPMWRPYLVLVLVAVAFAHYEFVSQLPTGANVPDGAGGYVEAIGHVNPDGGGENNAFGLAFITGWPEAYCGADSDGDGYGNGWELGDPCCSWRVGDMPLVSDNISHPGLASSVPIGRTNCSAIACSNGVTPTCAPSLAAQ